MYAFTHDLTNLSIYKHALHKFPESERLEMSTTAKNSENAQNQF